MWRHENADVDVDIPNEVIDACIERRLVLFAGAGVSTESSNVLPISFYDKVKSELAIEENLPFPDLMEVYVEKKGGRADLMMLLRNRIEMIKSFPELYRRATKFHRELAGIYHIREIFTTNWDTFFEDECGAVGVVHAKDCIFYHVPERKVYKLHGSTADFKSIVATTNDYKNRYEEISSGVMGSHLKALMASDIVVFLGYSFGDFDLNRVLEFVSAEMGDFLPKVYVVTRSGKIRAKGAIANKMMPIKACADDFARKLRLELEDRGELRKQNEWVDINELIEQLHEDHHKLSHVSLESYPVGLYSLAYQDGLMHLLERVKAREKTGEFTYAPLLEKKIDNFEKLYEEKVLQDKFVEAAYILGQRNGLKYLLAKPTDRQWMPRYYFFGWKERADSLESVYKMQAQSGNLNKKAVISAELLLDSIQRKGERVHPVPGIDYEKLFWGIEEQL